MKLSMIGRRLKILDGSPERENDDNKVHVALVESVYLV